MIYPQTDLFDGVVKPVIRVTLSYPGGLIKFEHNLNEYFRSIGYHCSDSGKNMETNVRELTFRDADLMGNPEERK